MAFKTLHSDSDSDFEHENVHDEQPSSPTSSDEQHEDNDYYFAFARIKGDVFLVQGNSHLPLSPLSIVDIKLFRHEFITIFRFSQRLTLHPADICILERIDPCMTKYEEENETVFLARGVMERLRRLSDPRWGVVGRGMYARGHGRSRSMGGMPTNNYNFKAGQQLLPTITPPSRMSFSTSSSPIASRRQR